MVSFNHKTIDAMIIKLRKMKGNTKLENQRRMSEYYDKLN